MTVPRMAPATVIRLMRARDTTPPREPTSAPNPRVQVFPSADGTVLLVGVTIAGKWVAEYRCLAEDFDERCVTAMERRVRSKERGRPPSLSLG